MREIQNCDGRDKYKMRRKHRLRVKSGMYMKPVPENRSTVSEGVGLVKPHGLSRKVVIGFPIEQVASCCRCPGSDLSRTLVREPQYAPHYARSRQASRSIACDSFARTEQHTIYLRKDPPACARCRS